MNMNIFSMVPIEVWRDKRLTLEQVRVLGVLLSFRAKNTDTVWPSRKQIAERCGMNVCNISTATSSLERLGWLRKDGKGGHSKATRYTITVPDLEGSGTVAYSATVAGQATVAPSATSTVAHSATPPVAEWATRKEQTIEQTTRTNHVNTPTQVPLQSGSAKTKFDARQHLLALGADQQTADDFLALRKAKRAPVTKTVVAAITREAGKAGISLDEVLQICCARGWQTFRADWHCKGGNRTASRPTPSPENFASVDYGQGGPI